MIIGVVCGRKFCGRCHHWLLAIYFNVHTRNKDGTPKRLQTYCKTCALLQSRENGGRLPREEYLDNNLRIVKGRPLTTEERAERRKELWKIRSKDPHVYARRKAYQRDYQRRLRREAGIAARNSRAPRPIIEADPNKFVSIGPFQQWLKDRIELFPTLRDFAKAIGLDERYIRHVLDESRQRINIDVVDKALLQEGRTMLWELYPEVFPFMTRKSKVEIDG